MDILSLSKSEIEKMGIVEYEEAFHYAATTYNIRSMGVSDKKTQKGDVIHFDQPADFGIDPNFMSNVGK